MTSVLRFDRGLPCVLALALLACDGGAAPTV